jgi:hypothetical protein
VALFLNIQTASDDLNGKVFEAWEPGGGAGLRILSSKVAPHCVLISQKAAMGRMDCSLAWEKRFNF